MKRTAVLLVGLVLAGSVLAVDENGAYGIMGIGNDRCGEYVSKVDEHKGIDALFTSWLNGYMTAFNRYVSNTFNIKGNSDVADLRKWLYGYCQENPSKYFEDATSALIAKLYPNRQQQKPN